MSARKVYNIRMTNKNPINTYQAVKFCGLMSPEETLRLIGESKLLVLPSECYETFGLVVIEAFMRGTPCLVSNLGALPDLVDNDKRCVFEVGNEKDLANHVQALFANEELSVLGTKGRIAYEAHYTEATNVHQLLSIYRRKK